MTSDVMEQLASIAAGGMSLEEARQMRETQARRLEAKIERRKAQVKETMKALRQHKTALATRLQKRQAEIVELKNEFDMVMADYKLECRKLAEQDSKDLHEFYLWAKDEIAKCAQSALERAPVEDNTEIMRALNVILKNC
ncbi:hypothetical protein BBBOND_0305480 [Babesia bigemina]|uniref:Uncharacterized protein n=1 Tax=Babesia bigemina TaxID=5866 RepID=A0A061DDW9_BABBI|nr:hypothetical protein BBBOND_0305480 [Babesia bigemina]CDR96645.1 hypothetical protein BBBOND_0305480 [Babesia bigemina]|eukprot:XP_012768831.1 hypothetical protein BBBOND_0305480 [Babesia bigemina]